MTGHSTLRDAPAAPKILAMRRVHGGPRPVETITLRLDGHEQRRDVVRAGKVAAVIAYDPARDTLVMLRQFRLPAHLAHGRGMLVEFVAGRVDPGEEVIAAARRECLEEIGLAPATLVPLFSYLTSPGYTDEEVTVFLGRVDAAHAPEHAGLEEEGERTQPLAVRRADAIAALDAGHISNGITFAALSWLARPGRDPSTLSELLA